MEILFANSQEELLHYLPNSRSTNFHALPKKKAEKRCVLRLLSTLGRYGELQFPIEIIAERERPDFECSFCASQVGIEVTKATTELYERAYAVREKSYPNAWLELNHFKWGASNKTNGEISKILEISQNEFTAPAIYGNYIEHEWVKGMEQCLTEKTRKLNEPNKPNKPKFEKFDKNWLLIFDNLKSTHFNYEIAINEFVHALKNYWVTKRSADVKFDRLIIDSNESLYVFDDSRFSEFIVLDM